MVCIAAAKHCNDRRIVDQQSRASLPVLNAPSYDRPPAATQEQLLFDPDGPFRLIDGEHWYVVHTLPCSEFRAQMQLEAQGFRTFLPRYRKTVCHSRKLRTVSAPFFPGYLFIALDLGRDRWRSVNGTFGVASLVMGQEFPVAVPSGIVEDLGAACTADGHMHLDEALGLGDCLRVLAGPFVDMVGVLARIDSAGRVTLLLRLFGDEVPVSISRAALMLARAG